jgi:hypothetical protein
VGVTESRETTVAMNPSAPNTLTSSDVDTCTLEQTVQ